MNCFVFRFILVWRELVPALLLLFYEGGVNTVDAVPALSLWPTWVRPPRVSMWAYCSLYFSAWGHSEATGGNLACVGESEVQALEQHQLMRKGNLWARPPVSSFFYGATLSCVPEILSDDLSGNGPQTPKGIACSNDAFINVSSLSNFLGLTLCFLCQFWFIIPVSNLPFISCSVIMEMGPVEFLLCQLAWC